jgi:hypothetical protein
MSRTSVALARTVRFAQHGAAGGVLTVFPGGEPAGVPFAIARVFTITGVARGGSRGNHAHRACTQLVICLAGAVDGGCRGGRRPADAQRHPE